MCELFNKLNQINVNDYVEKKQSGKVALSYLSWTYAVQEFTRAVGDWDYGRYPVEYDENLGYMVSTWIEVNGKKKEMWLPVMDGANMAMKNHPYKYTTKFNGEKTVNAASQMDINKAYMRCLVKNMAMFGLGLYIYAGEDLPSEVVEEERKEQPSKVKAEVVTEVTNSILPLHWENLKKRFGVIAMNNYLKSKGYTKASDITIAEYEGMMAQGNETVTNN